MKEVYYIRACREILEKVLAGEIADEKELNKVKKEVSKAISSAKPSQEWGYFSTGYFGRADCS